VREKRKKRRRRRGRRRGRRRRRILFISPRSTGGHALASL